MFNKLHFDVTFPSTGRRLTQNLTFGPGFTAIVGPNESGKSFIFEMLRFALFGTAALRGVADDYKTLKMSAEFTIKGEAYRVDRTSRISTLYRGEEIVAAGHTAVNTKIVQILGFGIEVFDMACSINQGEVERLGTLTPMQRKRMVDQVLGIDALEFVAKWAMDEARLLDKQAEAIRGRLQIPLQPQAPENYRPTAEIDLPKLRAEAEELASIEGFLAVDRPKPTEPTCTVSLPAENLRGLAQQRAQLRERVAGLKARIAALPAAVPHTTDQLEEADRMWADHERWNEARRWLAANPQPAHSREQLQLWLEALGLDIEWKAYDKVQDDLARVRHRLEHVHTVDCPACHHGFPLDQAAANELQQQVVALETIEPPANPRPDPIAFDLNELERGLRQWDTFDETKFAEMSAVVPVEAPAIARHMIPTHLAQHGQVAERIQLQQQLAVSEPKLAAMQDYEVMLAQREAYEAALPSYRTAVTEWEVWSTERAQKQVRARVLGLARMRLHEAERAHGEASVYEAALARFQQDWDRYSRDLQDAEAYETDAAEHRKVRELMNVLRSLIKQHLMPSLNKVSSHLLSLMTGGQRTVIAVDEDFNVVVDGQALDTLSGSGKACANLALRIALGQVLTNRVFSVLMADEIDAAMDDFRAEQTANVLGMLGNSISQVLQVSHKSIESLNQIDLGVSVDRTALLGEAA